MLKIDKGVPMPEVNKRGEYAATFKAMEVGDSFYVAVAAGRSEHGKRTNVWNHARRAGVRISMAKEDGGFRVWLVDKQETVKP